MKNKEILSIISAIILVVLISCKHESIPPIIDDTTVPSGICFQDEVLPVIQSNCAYSGCHAAGGEDPDLSTYSSIKQLVNAGDPQNSKLYKYAIGSEMPPTPKTPLNLEQVTLIYGWIKQGAPDNSCACDTNVFTFNDAVLPIIKRNCWGCHGVNDDIPLVTYQNIFDNADNILADISYENNPMPKPPTAKLSDCKITQIRKWINAGKLNN
jgi:mono/diheme cytochrome c family protein